MKWLIDLIIETIGVPPCYYDRGNFSGDFAGLDLNQDVWEIVDFSPVCPVGTKAVVIRIRAANSLAGESIQVQPFGTTEAPGHCSMSVHVANIVNRNIMTIGVDDDRKIKIKGTRLGHWTFESCSLRGWFK